MPDNMRLLSGLISSINASANLKLVNMEVDDLQYDSDSGQEDEDARIVALERLPNGRPNMQHAAVNMIVEMRGVAGMTRVGVRRAMDGAELVMKVNNMSLKEDVSEFLNRTGQINNPRAQNLLTKFDSVNPFHGIRSDDGQRSGIKRFFNFIQPEPIYIGDRIDQRLVGEEGARALIPVPDTFEYASITDVLKMVSRKRVVMDYIRNRRPSEDGMIESYTDSDEFREHPFFQRFPDAFQLVLYGDGVDPARVVGPKSGLHEIYHFCISILNLPPSLLYSSDSIFPIVMANALDCTGTFADVLGLFVQELRRLEDGVRVFLEDEFVTLRATLVAVKGDAKAIHEMLGFLDCSARHFCAQCMITRQELHAGQIALGEIRTPAMTEMQLQRVRENPAYSTNCGLKYRTVLHDSQYFRAENNNNSDLMHDGPEGLMMMLIRLTLRQFICIDNLFTVEELNQRIFAYDFGGQNAKDRPTPNFSYESLQNADHVYKQKMNAAQILVLLRVLPLLLDNIGQNGVDEDNEYLQYLLLYSKIFQLGSAPRIPRYVIPYLHRLIETFRVNWYILFPGINPINKFHHLMHLIFNILRKGPQRNYWCFKEEGKNCPLKRHVVVCGNFKNPHKTAMEQAQIRVAKVWGTQTNIMECIRKFVRRRDVTVRASPARINLLALGFEDNDEISVCDAVTVWSLVYRVGEFLLYGKSSENEDGLPRFGKIVSIICPENSNHTWFAVEAWRTAGLVERFNSYAVTLPENAPIHLIDVKDLPVHPAISRWSDYSSDLTYLCLKYKVY